MVLAIIILLILCLTNIMLLVVFTFFIILTIYIAHSLGNFIVWLLLLWLWSFQFSRHVFVIIISSSIYRSLHVKQTQENEKEMDGTCSLQFCSTICHTYDCFIKVRKTKPVFGSKIMYVVGTALFKTPTLNFVLYSFPVWASLNVSFKINFSLVYFVKSWRNSQE